MQKPKKMFHHYMPFFFLQIANVGLVSEVDKLRNKVGELEKEREERMDERKRERVENETTISSLTVELSSLRTQLQQNKKTEGERVKMVRERLYREVYTVLCT